MKGTYDNAIRILRTLKSAGHSSYLAGGCVRDILLGLSPNDYDITTSATPEQVQALFERTIPVGISFGVIKVVLEGGEFDVATFRTDGKYSDNRRPDDVTFSNSAEEDVKRRDFTINALLMNDYGEVIDHVGGVNDLNNKILRTVGNAQDRFTEDPLRMFRAIRFAIRFRLDIDPQLWSSIKAMKSSIKTVSKERVTDELSRMFCYSNADRAYFALRRSGLWLSWFEEAPDQDDSWRSLYALTYVRPEDPFVLSLAIILAETYSHRRKDTLDRLTLTSIQRKSFESLLSRVDPMNNFLHKSLSEQRKMMQWEDKELIFKFIEYQRDGRKYDNDIPSGLTQADYQSKIAEVAAMGWPGPLVTGKDLIQMGFMTGPIFTKMLDLVREEQLEGRLLKIEDVKPFLISRFPATPRKLEDGSDWDDTRHRRIVAQCPGCSRSMSLEVPKNDEGKYQWSQGRNRINMKTYDTSTFAHCGACSSRKKKTNFVEVTI